jgi:hypothetical protein
MTGPRTLRLAFPTVLFLAAICTNTRAQSSAPATSPGCGVLNNVTTCNWHAFHPLLKKSSVIAVEHGNIDRFTGRQLSELAERLGKTVASPDHPGDLTFVIAPATEHGIDIGPADQPIADLQIYAGPTSRGQLLWVETFRGDPDRPWPSSVHSVIDQFEARLAKPQ